jgi:hypothetical protein
MVISETPIRKDMVTIFNQRTSVAGARTDGRKMAEPEMSLARQTPVGKQMTIKRRGLGRQAEQSALGSCAHGGPDVGRIEPGRKLCEWETKARSQIHVTK